jgi:hypothetical protein
LETFLAEIKSIQKIHKMSPIHRIVGNFFGRNQNYSENSQSPS